MICSAPLDAYDVMLERAARVRAARPEVVVGVHLEGPFLGGAPGAHPPDVLRSSEIGFLAGLHETYGDLVRIMTLAPEADPGFAATRLLVRQGVIVALGHSVVDYDGARAAAEAGATAAIQPGGAVRDEEVIKAADERGMTMVFTGIRHFKH